MHRNIQTIFVISTLVVLVLSSACVLPGSESVKQNTGLSQITNTVEISRISFDEARQKLSTYRTDSLHESGNVKTIYYVHANDMDESGNAASWVFGVKNTTTTALLVYDGKGWTVIPWIITSLPSEDIDDQTVSPGKLFAQNKAVIFSGSSPATAERRDFELKEGIYTITITSGNTNRILTFNATTGVLIA